MQLQMINSQLLQDNFKQLSTKGPESGNFPDLSEAVRQQIAEIQDRQSAASSAIRQVELGESDNLVGAMLAAQKASISFDIMVAVRNKVLTAYQDLVKMPL